MQRVTQQQHMQTVASWQKGPWSQISQQELALSFSVEHDALCWFAYNGLTTQAWGGPVAEQHLHPSVQTLQLQ